MKKILAAVLGLTGLLLTGCFDIEQTLTLEKNMSGKAGYAMKVNMEPMVGFMTRMKRSMEGKEGEPTAAELAEARKEFLAQREADPAGNFEKSKAELQSKLPKGVTLLDSSFKAEEMSFNVNFLFGFDHIDKLREIEFAKSGDEQAAAPGPPSPPGPGSMPVESPFGGLQFVDEGKTFLLTSPTQNPIADQKEQASQMELSPEDKKQMEEMFKGLRVAFKITSPMEVVEHNAHRKQGNTLVWEYDLKKLESMKPDEAIQGVRVRFKK